MEEIEQVENGQKINFFYAFAANPAFIEIPTLNGQLLKAGMDNSLHVIDPC